MDLAGHRSCKRADQEAMDTPAIHTIQRVRIRCDMTSIWVDRAARREREERLLFSRMEIFMNWRPRVGGKSSCREIKTNKCERNYRVSRLTQARTKVYRIKTTSSRFHLLLIRSQPGAALLIITLMSIRTSFTQLATHLHLNRRCAIVSSVELPSDDNTSAWAIYSEIYLATHLPLCVWCMKYMKMITHSASLVLCELRFYRLINRMLFSRSAHVTGLHNQIWQSQTRKMECTSEEWNDDEPRVALNSPSLRHIIIISCCVGSRTAIHSLFAHRNFNSRNGGTFPRHKFASSSMVHKGYPHLALRVCLRVFS